jgi:outer membrane receptor protein involved in Fe transport
MRNFLIGLGFSLIAHAVSGQQISGTLVNSENTPLEGAYVFNHTSGAHAHTNENGYFTISDTQAGDTLKLGALGYQKLVLPLKESQFSGGLSLVMEEAALQLSEVIIKPEINALSVLAEVDLKIQPVGSSQEILQKVPGLFIGQHAGGGKAEQLFLRGFDIDHGTDIAISVDNMPVNMVSHAHGQGYSDLHFVIPETLQSIDFDKGPYHTDKGNFATAGYVNFRTRDRLDKNTVQVEYGDYGWNRNLGMFNILDQKLQKAYIATEYLRFDGPFESSQNFSRFNLFGKYTITSNQDSRFSATASHFTSTWDASGQIPQRAVEQGLIGRFGAIDDTEGGTTSRSNLNLEYFKVLGDGSFFKTNAFWSKYDFELFSNFTFFLEDPENGDQITQRESRDLYGLNSSWNKDFHLGDAQMELTIGSGLRTDQIRNNELSKTANRREILERVQLGDIEETNLFGYVDARLRWDKFTLLSGLRVDHFEFGYVDALSDVYENQRLGKTAISPKLNLLYNHNQDLQLFVKSGVGFHSNDSRVVLRQNTREILPMAYGVDVGTIFRSGSQLVFNAALWHLYLEQEFVYVGDAGIVEPSGRSERQGIDLGVRYQINDWLYFHSDLTYSKARSLDANNGEDYIPLAPGITLAGGLTANGQGKWSGGIRYRYLGDRPANEDNSIVAEGYLVFDSNINYKLLPDLSLGVTIQNLFNVDWNETQFATNSRLEQETEAVEEIHFTPGVPFYIQGRIRYSF